MNKDKIKEMLIEYFTYGVEYHLDNYNDEEGVQALSDQDYEWLCNAIKYIHGTEQLQTMIENALDATEDMQ